MGRLFGTDGVRGLANVSLTPELALAVARASVAVLAPPNLAAVTAHGDPVRPLAVVGRDPRASGEMLEAAVVAGLTSAGADVLRVGVLPTPAISHLTSVYDADLGVMLSASHNPMPDNGIKVFAAGGAKLPDEVEDRIEALVLGAAGEAGDAAESATQRLSGTQRLPGTQRPSGAHVGRVRDAADAAVRYQDFLLAGLDHRLDGLRIVVDCAHGAAAAVAPEVYRRAGAEVLAIAASPDGLNINDGVGSTHLDGLIAAVREHGADLGIAHDGDADRCLAVDGAGEIVDGDQILALCALALRERGALRGDAVVATVMSNIGFHQAMRGAGIEVETTPVGDRYVLEALARRGLSLGGEQSGHVVFADRCSTGDGLLTALTVMSAVVASGRSLAELAAVVQRAPQILVNVAVADKNAVLASPRIAEALRDAQSELGDGGRVLLRPSGTEALFRVMVEAPTQVQADDVARRLAELVAAV